MDIRFPRVDGISSIVKPYNGRKEKGQDSGDKRKRKEPEDKEFEEYLKKVKEDEAEKAGRIGIDDYA